LAELVPTSLAVASEDFPDLASLDARSVLVPDCMILSSAKIHLTISCSVKFLRFR
jgi:hypothetical protein